MEQLERGMYALLREIDSAAEVTIFEIPIWAANELLLDWHLFPLQV